MTKAVFLKKLDAIKDIRDYPDAKLLKSGFTKRALRWEFKDFDKPNNEFYDIIYNYITEYKPEGKGLYLYSKNPGIGKTVVATAVSRVLINKGIINTGMKLIKYAQFIDEAREGNIGWTKFIYLLKIADLIILDDIGAEFPPTESTSSKLYQILDMRLDNEKQLMMTSNYSPEDLINRLVGEDVLKNRIRSRLDALCFPVNLDKFFDKSDGRVISIAAK